MSELSDDLTQAIQDFQARIKALPPGGDLEGLLEEESAQLKRLLYQLGLDTRRQVAASSPEAFSPSRVPKVPGASAPRGNPSAARSDAGGESEL